MATRSSPTVSCLSIAWATASLVPTPSVDEASTRLAIAAAQREQPGEAAEPAAYLGPGRLARQRFEEFDGAVTSFDVHPGRCVGDAVLCGAIGHRDQIYRAGRAHGMRRPLCVLCAMSGAVELGMTRCQEPLVLQVLYIDPAGAPLSDDAPDPGCGFA